MLPALLVKGIVEGVGLLLAASETEGLFRLGSRYVLYNDDFLVENLDRLLTLLLLLLDAEGAAPDCHQDVRVTLLHLGFIIIGILFA